MILALITLVKSLFYDFHNDTVPIVSIAISCAISLLCAAIVIGTGLCIVLCLRSVTFKSQLLWTGAIILLNLIFSAVCLLVHSEKFRLTAIYFLASAFLTAAAFVSGRINNKT
jgi:hypothetical protein